MTSRSGKLLTDLLLIPMMDVQTGRFFALHRVFGRPGADGKFGKGWCTSAGGVFPIGVDVRCGPVCVGEGIATAFSVYEVWSYHGEPEHAEDVLPYCSVLACMDSGNMARQAREIRQRYSNRRLIVIQDDDEAGEKAAHACMDAGFNGVWSADAEKVGG